MASKNNFEEFHRKLSSIDDVAFSIETISKNNTNILRNFNEKIETYLSKLDVISNNQIAVLELQNEVQNNVKKEMKEGFDKLSDLSNQNISVSKNQNDLKVSTDKNLEKVLETIESSNKLQLPSDLPNLEKEDINEKIEKKLENIYKPFRQKGGLFTPQEINFKEEAKKFMKGESISPKSKNYDFFKTLINASSKKEQVTEQSKYFEKEVPTMNISKESIKDIDDILRKNIRTIGRLLQRYSKVKKTSNDDDDVKVKLTNQPTGFLEGLFSAIGLGGLYEFFKKKNTLNAPKPKISPRIKGVPKSLFGRLGGKLFGAALIVGLTTALVDAFKEPLAKMLTTLTNGAVAPKQANEVMDKVSSFLNTATGVIGTIFVGKSLLPAAYSAIRGEKGTKVLEAGLKRGQFFNKAGEAKNTLGKGLKSKVVQKLGSKYGRSALTMGKNFAGMGLLGKVGAAGDALMVGTGVNWGMNKILPKNLGFSDDSPFAASASGLRENLIDAATFTSGGATLGYKLGGATGARFGAMAGLGAGEVYNLGKNLWRVGSEGIDYMKQYRPDKETQLKFKQMEDNNKAKEAELKTKYGENWRQVLQKAKVSKTQKEADELSVKVKRLNDTEKPITIPLKKLKPLPTEEDMLRQKLFPNTTDQSSLTVKDMAKLASTEAQQSISLDNNSLEKLSEIFHKSISSIDFSQVLNISNSGGGGDKGLLSGSRDPIYNFRLASLKS